MNLAAELLLMVYKCLYLSLISIYTVTAHYDKDGCGNLKDFNRPFSALLGYVTVYFPPLL